MYSVTYNIADCLSFYGVLNTRYFDYWTSVTWKRPLKLKRLNLFSPLCQPSRDIRSQEEWVYGWAAEERRRNEANVCPTSQRKGGGAQRSREGGRTCCSMPCCLLFKDAVGNIKATFCPVCSNCPYVETVVPKTDSLTNAAAICKNPPHLMQPIRARGAYDNLSLLSPQP